METVKSRALTSRLIISALIEVVTKTCTTEEPLECGFRLMCYWDDTKTKDENISGNCFLCIRNILELEYKLSCKV